MKRFGSGFMIALLLATSLCYAAQIFQGSITGNSATVTGLSVSGGKTFTVNNTLTLIGTDGSTLNIGAGGTLGTGAFAAAYVLPTATSGVLGGVKPDGTTITNSSGAISVTYGTTSGTAAQGNDPRLGAGAVTGAIKSNGSNSFSQAGYSDLATGAPTATNSVLGLVKPDNVSILNSGGVLTATPASIGAAPAYTTLGGLTCSVQGGENVCYFAGSMASSATLTLPTVTTGWSGQGEITIGADADHASFTTDASGNVNLVWTSSGIVANAATASKFQLGASTPANPIVLTNATGGSINVVVTFRTH